MDWTHGGCIEALFFVNYFYIFYYFLLYKLCYQMLLLSVDTSDPCLLWSRPYVVSHELLHYDLYFILI